MSEAFTPQESAGSTGFLPDPRFAPQPDAPPAPEPDDPAARAWAEGFAAGSDQVRAETASRDAADDDARSCLSLEFRKLDTALAADLQERLRAAVIALCQSALAPLALDEAALLRRIERAVEMLARAGDERTIRLHPDDLALVSPRLAADWRVEPDPALERGALRVETPDGGVEDGPLQWASALEAAMRQC